MRVSSAKRITWSTLIVSSTLAILFSTFLLTTNAHAAAEDEIPTDPHIDPINRWNLSSTMAGGYWPGPSLL